MQSLFVRVPATSANLGSGFDALGMALQIHNHFHFQCIPEGRQLDIQGELSAQANGEESTLFFKVLDRFYEVTGRPKQPLKITIEGQVPLRSGLGSSATAIVGALVGANELAKRPLATPALLRLAAELEGHADNVTPALLGGFTVATRVGDDVRWARFAPPKELRAVLVTPQMEVSTRHSRAALPEQVERTDAVFNIARASMLTAAMATGDLTQLALGMEDRLHQRYRLGSIPGAAEAIDAAKQAGALGACLSGSGPTVIALATERFEGIAAAMGQVFTRCGLPCQCRIASPDTRGAVIAGEEPEAR